MAVLLVAAAIGRHSFAGVVVSGAVFLIYGPGGAVVGAAIGLIAALLIAPFIAAWLGREDLSGQPLDVVANLARWRATGITLIVVCLANLTALGTRPSTWLFWYFPASILAVGYAWFASGRIVSRISGG
jgi:hypothetical protein